jgi:hypothetical protein
MKKSDKTLSALEDALIRIVSGDPIRVDPDRRLSIKSVAEEAGLHHSTIHTRYPEFRDKIMNILGGNKAKSKNEKVSGSSTPVDNSAGLRAEILTLRNLITQMASENARLELENVKLKALLESDNVIAFPS